MAGFRQIVAGMVLLAAMVGCSGGVRAPGLVAVMPLALPAGSPDHTLHLTGNAFVPGDVVGFGPTPLKTSYLSPTEIDAVVPAALLVFAGTFPLSLGDGSGPAVVTTFTVQVINPVPVAVSVDPASVQVQSSAASLLITGSGFVAATTAQMDGSARTLAVVDAEHARVQLRAMDVAVAAVHTLVVTNPAPGGGSASALPLTVLNPVPTLAGLAPATFPLDGAGALAIVGTGFVPGTLAMVDGLVRSTIYGDAQHLSLALTTADVGTARTFPVAVRNAGPGGGTSQAALVTVQNPLPAVSTVTPSVLVVGSDPGLLQLTGSGLLPRTTAQINGSARQVTYRDGQHLAVAATAADVQAPGTLQLVLGNAAPGGGLVTATIAVQNPVPAELSISPASLVVSPDPVTLTIAGSGLFAGTTALFDGQPRTVHAIDPMHISVALAAGDAQVAHIGQLLLSNAAPGGGSVAASVAIDNPAPAVVSILPATVPLRHAGSLMVTGTGLLPSTTAQVGGQARTLTYQDGEHVIVSLTDADVQTAGVLSLFLTNAGPGGGTSAAATVTVLNPAPSVQQLSTTTFRSGASSATVVVTGSNFLPSTVASVDGSTRATTFLDDTHVSVSLTADDLLFATTRTLRVNSSAPGGGASGGLEFQVHNLSRAASTYYAFGDSITEGYGVGLPDAYPTLLGAANGLKVTDQGQAGEQACDLFAHQLYPAVGIGYAPAPDAVYSLMMGSNDVLVWGVGTHEAVFNACHQAGISWLGVPRASKVLAGDAAAVATGACAAGLFSGPLNTMYCTGAGTLADSAFATEGNPLYVWYLLDDAAPAAAAFTVQVDGVAVATKTTVMTPGVATHNGATVAIALLRVPLERGTHAVVVSTATGSVGILGFGTVPASTAGLPFVVVGDVPFLQRGSTQASIADQDRYVSDIRNNVALLYADGVDVRFAPTRLYLLGTAAEMNDFVHPNVLGQMHLQQAFQTGFADLAR